MFTGFDPVGVPVIRLLRGRIAAYNMHLRAIADARGCYLVDLWSMRFLRAPGRLVARPAAPDRRSRTSGWRCAPARSSASRSPRTGATRWTRTRRSPRSPAVARAAWMAARREDARWAREYLAPWVNRRLHGTSSGDGRTAKRPALEAMLPPIVM